MTLVVGSTSRAGRHTHIRKDIGATRFNAGTMQQCDAERRDAATAPSNGAIHVVPKRPSLRVYDPFYGPPARRSPHCRIPSPSFYR